MNDVQCVHIQDVSVRCIRGKKVHLDILNNNMFLFSNVCNLQIPGNSHPCYTTNNYSF